MKAHLTVRVRPRSSRPGLERTGDREYRVAVKAAPEDGRANAEVIELLSEHLSVPRSCFKIVRGAKARTKLISVDSPGES